jgi:hypothetical protein
MSNELEIFGSMLSWTVRVFIPEIYLEGLRKTTEYPN